MTDDAPSVLAYPMVDPDACTVAWQVGRRRRVICLAIMARKALWIVRRHRDPPERWRAPEPWSGR